MKWKYVWNNRLNKFFDNPRAIFPFLKKKLYYNFIADRYLKYYHDFHYLNYQETLDSLINENKSIVRFGDELFDMLNGIGLYYGNWHQRYRKDLAAKLKEVISSRNPKLLVCFNPELILKTKEEFVKEGIGEQYQFWTNSKIFLKDYFHPNMIYGSALCFNPHYNKNIDYKALKDFFSKKDVIIISSDLARFNNIKLGRTTHFISAPKSDAWDRYEDIKTEVLSLIEYLGDKKEDTLVLASIGSASKVLAYELTNLGYTVWDTGQFFDLAFNEIKKISHHEI